MTSTSITTTPVAPVNPMEAFQEKIKSKLREDIASLLPDDAIAAMVQKVIDDEFFAKRSVRANPNSYHDVSMREVPTKFQEMVLAAAKPIIEAQVNKVISDNADRISKQLDDTVNAGLIRMTLSRVDEVLSGIIHRQLGGVNMPMLVDALKQAGIVR